MISRMMAMTAATAEVFHPDFLGAHRYTTASGGIVRPAGGLFKHSYRSDLLCHLWPALAQWARQDRVLAQRQEVRCMYGC